MVSVPVSPVVYSSEGAIAERRFGTIRSAGGAVKDLFGSSAAFRTGAILLLVMLGLGALSFVSPYGPTDRRVVPIDRGPSLQYLLGTTSLGQDVFWLTTFAIRNSLMVATVAVLISRTIAVLVGSSCGYLGGRFDRVVSSITDSFIVIPRLPLLILISFMVRGSLSMMELAVLIGILDWAWPSKRYRAQVLTLREEEFTNTAVFAGMGTLKIILREHLPFLIPFLLADAVSGFLFAIGMEVTLSVLGLSDLGSPTIGTMIYWAGYYQALLARRFWWLGAPIVASVLLVVGMYLVSISVGSYLDPRTRLKNLAARGNS